jgi:beta-N-acetylhexosaminidase
MFPNLDAELPASLSPRVIRRLLRDQLGFDHHLVLSDDLELAAISSRFGLGPAARLALEAGGDLVLIGHSTGAAREVAAALANLPHLVLAEAWERVERLRDKLHWPMAWSGSKWSDACDKVAALAAEVPEAGAAG